MCDLKDRTTSKGGVSADCKILMSSLASTLLYSQGDLDPPVFLCCGIIDMYHRTIVPAFYVKLGISPRALGMLVKRSVN